MQVDFSAFEERMLGKGFGKVLGAKLVHVEDGLCKIRLDYRPELSRGDELIHGGVIAALIDKAATAAAWSYADLTSGARGATVSLNINYLSGAASCDLMATGTVLRRGGSLTIIDVVVTDPDEQLISKATVTYKLTPERKR